MNAPNSLRCLRSRISPQEKTLTCNWRKTKGGWGMEERKGGREGGRAGRRRKADHVVGN